MLKVYQIFLDGAAGWITMKPKDFEDEIVANYYLEYDREIPQGRLKKIMGQIENMDIGDNIKFDNMKFYCFEIEEDMREFYEV